MPHARYWKQRGICNSWSRSLSHQVIQWSTFGCLFFTFFCHIEWFKFVLFYWIIKWYIMRANSFFKKPFETKLPQFVSVKNIFIGFFCRYQSRRSACQCFSLFEWVIPLTNQIFATFSSSKHFLEGPIFLSAQSFYLCCISASLKLSNIFATAWLENDLWIVSIEEL